jgi:hypothetical protein
MLITSDQIIIFNYNIVTFYKQVQNIFKYLQVYIFIYLSHTLKGKKKKNGKVIPLHAMEVHGVRGGIAPTHS